MSGVTERPSKPTIRYRATCACATFSPNDCSGITDETAKPPSAPAIHPRNAMSENASVLFSSPALSASNALPETAKAASPIPSTAATRRTSARLAVSANPIRLRLAAAFPRISILRLPYLSASMPRGKLASTRDMAMTPMVTPIQKLDSP